MNEFDNIRKALLWLEGYCVDEPKAGAQLEGIRQNLNRIETHATVQNNPQAQQVRNINNKNGVGWASR